MNVPYGAFYSIMNFTGMVALSALREPLVYPPHGGVGISRGRSIIKGALVIYVIVFITTDCLVTEDTGYIFYTIWSMMQLNFTGKQKFRLQNSLNFTEPLTLHKIR